MKRHSPIKRPKTATKLVVAALAAAIVLLLMLNLLQTQLLFPTHAVPLAGPMPPNAERMEVRASNGDRLQGIYLRPRIDSDDATLILGFGGNAWNGQHVAMELHRLFPAAHVVAFHYRGYPPSTGTPSAKALIEDAPHVYDAAVRLIGPKQVVAVGFSIGSAIAAHLSEDRALDGVILVTPFDSLKLAASDLFPWLPVGAFFAHEMDTAGALAGSDIPVAIIAAGNDEIIAAKRTDTLRKMVPNLVYDRTVAGAGHNDIYGRSEFDGGMHEALAIIGAVRK